MRSRMRGKEGESLLPRGDLHKISNKVNFKVAEHIFFSFHAFPTSYKMYSTEITYSTYFPRKMR